METERYDEHSSLSTSVVEESVKMIQKQLVPCLENSMDKLQSIWEEIGLSLDQKEERTRVVLEHLQDLLEEMVNEEDGLKNTLLSNIDAFRGEVGRLVVELELPAFEVEEGISLVKLESILRTRAEELKLVKRDRLKQMRTLREDEKKFCDRLCLPPHNLGGPVVVPTQEQLREIEANLEYLRNEMSKRLQTLEILLASIKEMWVSLEIDAKTALERELSEFDVMETFVLSAENMESVKELNMELERQQRAAIATADELREQVKSLWQKLEVDPDQQAAFLAKHSGSTPTVIFGLREEIEKMKHLRLQHMQKFIEGLRKELHTLWDKCFYGSSQRQEFRPAFDDNFTEELLEVHEQELEKVKSYYEEHKHMFKMVEKRESMFKKMREFELKEKDVNRFANRGGALLKEEKIRKTLLKELPKTEKDLKAEVAQWETDFGRPFIIDGCRYLDGIDEQWEALKREKEEQKEMRHKRQKQIMNEEMVFGSKPTTPAKRRFIGTPAKTPNKMRKMDGTLTPLRMQMSTAHTSVCPSPRRAMGRPPLSSAKKTALKSKTPKRVSARLAAKRQVLRDHNPNTSQLNSTMVPAAAVSGSKMTKDISLISCASYKDFAVGLAEGEANVRSSLATSDRMHSIVSFV